MHKHQQQQQQLDPSHSPYKSLIFIEIYTLLKKSDLNSTHLAINNQHIKNGVFKTMNLWFFLSLQLSVVSVLPTERVGKGNNMAVGRRVGIAHRK
jgi:hypothetical protein